VFCALEPATFADHASRPIHFCRVCPTIVNLFRAGTGLRGLAKDRTPRGAASPRPSPGKPNNVEAFAQTIIQTGS
jgi:hypothetical protein